MLSLSGVRIVAFLDGLYPSGHLRQVEVNRLRECDPHRPSDTYRSLRFAPFGYCRFAACARYASQSPKYAIEYSG